MRKLVLSLWVVAMLALTLSCAKKSDQPRATVALKDGTIYSGTVVSTTPAEITVAGDDHQTRTFAVKDVRSIEYADQTPPPAEQAQAPAPGQAPAGEPASRAPSPEYRQSPPERAESPSFFLPVGTRLSVRTNETIDSRTAVPGQTFAGQVAQDVTDASGAVAIPRGSNAQIVIRDVSRSGAVTGTNELALDLEWVSVDGRRYQIDTADISQRGNAGLGKNKRTGAFVGGGAALGAVIGAIAGGGKGAAIGAISGAGAGAATQVLTRGKAIRVPAETLLTFRLDKTLRVTPAR